jgi:hypothetical protein
METSSRQTFVIVDDQKNPIYVLPDGFKAIRVPVTTYPGNTTNDEDSGTDDDQNESKPIRIPVIIHPVTDRCTPNSESEDEESVYGYGHISPPSMPATPPALVLEPIQVPEYKHAKNPWNCLCKICTHLILTDKDNCASYLLQPREEMDKETIVDLVKAGLDKLDHTRGSEQRITVMVPMWQIYLGNTWFMKRYKKFCSIACDKLIEFMKDPFILAPIFGKLLWIEFDRLGCWDETYYNGLVCPSPNPWRCLCAICEIRVAYIDLPCDTILLPPSKPLSKRDVLTRTEKIIRSTPGNAVKDEIKLLSGILSTVLGNPWFVKDNVPFCELFLNRITSLSQRPYKPAMIAGKVMMDEFLHLIGNRAPASLDEPLVDDGTVDDGCDHDDQQERSKLWNCMSDSEKRAYLDDELDEIIRQGEIHMCESE